MIRKNIVDEYFGNGPVVTFSEDLKIFEPAKIFISDNGKREDCVDVAGIYLDKGDFGKDELLRVSFDDFLSFACVNGLAGSRYRVILRKDDSYEKEEYDIKASDSECAVTAGEREGVRRALIRIQDILVVNGGKIPKKTEHKKYTIKRRISRCFFTPINRPPRNIDELENDEDYYPDGYLHKLMHDGVNAIWLSSDYASLIKSSYITEFGEGSEKRIKKLNKVIEKCARYGIEVFVFLIEPISLFEPSVTRKYPRLYEKYPQVHGNGTGGPTAFCTFTDFGEKYLSECVRKLFESAPDLAGIISITYGERVTSCANSWGNSEGVWSNDCPHCKDKSQMEIVAHTVDIIVKSMKAAKPSAEFISWTYGQRGHSFSQIDEYLEKLPRDAVSMQNFEDDGRVTQLEKKRFALDYYLCYAGPSDMFSYTARVAEKLGKRLYAKMQICCSHELASMPYIPVPGLIYDKMTAAVKLGVTGVMESWFFGNYPCFMSKAVDILSGNKVKDKREFLQELAELYFGKDNAEKAADAWELFEKAYKNYPVNVMFNYYGPMHDGVAWELSLLPKNFSLPRTWKLEDKPDGDRIGECLFTGHTLSEAITLCGKLNALWKRGVKILESVSGDTEETRAQTDEAKALGILFDSGLDILKFYEARNDLGYGRGDAGTLLRRMRALVKKEMKNSKKMIPFCEKYNAFGYHSEAEGYKFFPEKLKSRISALEKLLKEEFPIVEERLEKGLSPLAYYYGEEDGVKHMRAGEKGLESASWYDLDDGVTKFRIADDGDGLLMEFSSDIETDFFVCNEFELFFPQPTYIFKRDGNVKLHRDARSHQSVLDKKYDEYISKWSITPFSENGKTHIIARANKKEAGFVRFPYKLMVRTFSGGNWCKDTIPVRVLGKSTTSPGDFGWVVR